jgi:hypothetical protein
MAYIGRPNHPAVLSTDDIAANTVQASDLNSTWYSSNSHVYIPAGTTADRPGSPVKGYMRFNGETGSAEIWNGTEWTAVGGGGAGLQDTLMLMGA